ncbi:MAG TPA: hypothetical protein VKC15_13305 [Gemmatimonadales bacterium]|nr:hypothetical protein [Gemmatimonadales bacterium]
METKALSLDQYLRQLRALGAWWRVGSSALEPQRLIEAVATHALAGHGSVDVEVIENR